MQDVVKIMRDIKSVPLKCISCAACAPQIEYVKVNDIVVVKPGNKIPTDGIIIEGETSIDESMITG
ncbi:hypothetical protein KQI30_04695 [Clostridium bornimense]|nr:hypothetical protein [Clostridium bornimense]